jgi:hypothetical protein
MISGSFMDSEIESDQLSVIQMSLGQRVKQNFTDIKTGFKV